MFKNNSISFGMCFRVGCYDSTTFFPGHFSKMGTSSWFSREMRTDHRMKISCIWNIKFPSGFMSTHWRMNI